MAQIVDYGTLVSAVTDYYDRSSDTGFTSRIDTFIGLAEDSFTPELLNRQMEETVSLTTADGTGVLPLGAVALPADFYRLRALTGIINGSNIDIPPIGPRAAANLYPDATTDFVVYHMIIGSTLYVVPAQVQVLTLDYYGAVKGLSASNTTNWLIATQPSLYMAAVMAQAAIWLQDWTNAQNFGTQAQLILDRLTENLALDQFNNAEMVLDTVTP